MQQVGTGTCMYVYPSVNSEPLPANFCTGTSWKWLNKYHSRHVMYNHLQTVSWAGFELVSPASLVTTHLYIPSLLSWTLTMVRVLVVAPDTPAGGGSRSVPFSCHWYVSDPAPVVAATVNVTVDPGSISVWFAGCWVIWGGLTGGERREVGHYHTWVSFNTLVHKYQKVVYMYVHHVYLSNYCSREFSCWK